MSDEKTEQPSAKKLRDARNKGQVAKSQDVPSALTTMGIALYLLTMGPSMLQDFINLGSIPILVMNKSFDDAFGIAFFGVFGLAVQITLPIIALVMVLGLVANLGQAGFLFSMEAMMPKLENLSPSKWFKKVFAMKNLIEFLKNIIKVVVIGYIVYSVFLENFALLFQIPRGSVYSMIGLIASIISDMMLQAAAAFCVIAAIDYVYQSFQFTKQNMMSKDEVKREYKESEGDPQVKGQRKQLQQEMASQNTLGQTRKAKVLVTNPTHFAVALDYDKETRPLPFVLAKGQDALAQRMIEIAKEEGIPIMRNVSLARSLYAEGTENAYIPKELIQAVAEVIRFIQQLNR